MSKEKIIFLDRDGTISIDEGYTFRPEKMMVYPGAADAIADLKLAGFRIIIVTNQSAVGRGMCSIDDVKQTNNECLSQLRQGNKNALVDDVLFCPHAPAEQCNCRKPGTGLVRSESFPWTLNENLCWMIGDKCSDIEFGLNLGLPKNNCILVLTGEGIKESARASRQFGAELSIVADLQAAAKLITDGPR